MKNSAMQLALCLIAITIISTLAVPGAWAKRNEGISFQVFYDNLDPYGKWIRDREYGYVWIPNAEPDFQPYATRGHWIMTSYGNTWVSDYPWGWATFHYGRWHFDDFYGWEWIPGDEWGPAWVNWRSGDGYYGWTPMEPGVRINISINIPLARWVFVPQRYICHPEIHRYYSPRSKTKIIIRNTTVINNVYVYNDHRYVSGPAAREIERVTRSRVPVYRVNNEPRPGYARAQNGSIGMYRPEIDRRSNAAPSHASDDRRGRYTDQNPTGRQSTNQPEAQPDRSPAPDRNRTTRVESSPSDQNSGTRSPAQTGPDIFNRQRDQRTVPDNSSTDRSGKDNSNGPRDEKREPVRNMPQRMPQRQESPATQERPRTEQARPAQKEVEKRSRTSEPSSEQGNQKQREKDKEQAPSGRDALGRQRPGRV